MADVATVSCTPQVSQNAKLPPALQPPAPSKDQIRLNYQLSGACLGLVLSGAYLGLMLRGGVHGPG